MDEGRTSADQGAEAKERRHSRRGALSVHGDDAAGDALSAAAIHQTDRVSSQAQVVATLVQHEGAPDDGQGAGQGEGARLLLQDCRPVDEVQVAQVTSVFRRRSWVPVVLRSWVEVAAGRAAVVAQVAKLMHMDAVRPLQAVQASVQEDASIWPSGQRDEAADDVAVEDADGALDCRRVAGLQHASQQEAEQDAEQGCQ